MIEKRQRRRKPKEGDVFAIPLGDGTIGFCQVCSFNSYAYFDLRCKAIPVIDDIVSQNVLFRVLTVQDAAKTGAWILIGNHSLQGKLAEHAIYWHQSVCSNDLEIYMNDQFYPATREEVEGLERLSAWSDCHIVERLLDHYSGRTDGIAYRTNKIKTYNLQTGEEIDLPI